MIKNSLEERFFGIALEGEISGFKNHSSGHWYFSLKDEGAIIRAIVWKSVALKLGFVPKDGEKVVVTGNITVYPPQGSYQITCTSMRKAGIGEILAELERRKRYYESRGYFDPALKKPIPANPSKIAVITSAQGAALQDILNITKRRSNADIIVLSAAVQGEGADDSVAKRIRQVNKYKMADVMIVGRGGGSIEDLLPFSSEKVIEAIRNSEIPVISAVGHEVDWALSDFVADLRAPTPSAAAELVCRDKNEEIRTLKDLQTFFTKVVNSKLQTARLSLSDTGVSNLRYRITNRISSYRMDEERLKAGMRKRVSEEILQGAAKRFSAVNTAVFRYEIERKISSFGGGLQNMKGGMERGVKERLRVVNLKIESLKLRLPNGIDENIIDCKRRLSAAKSVIEASGMQVETILKRGFSIVRGENGKIVKDAAEVAEGNILDITFSEGSARVKAMENGKH